MSKTTLTEEVAVLRFFETGPIDTVKVVFNIVSEKMRQRLESEGPSLIPQQKRRSTRGPRAANGTDDTPASSTS